MERFGHGPATQPSSYSLSCLQNVLGPEPSIIAIRDQKDFIQQLGGVDTESHGQTFAGDGGVLQRKVRKDQRNQKGQGHTMRTLPTESMDWNLCRLTETREPVGVCLGLLRIYNG